MITAGSLAGRVFVVTGAGGTGIASGIVAAITAHGGRVAGIELREDTFPSEAVADGDERVLRPLADISDADDVRRVSRVDVRGTWLCCRESVRHRRATGWAGSIVNVSSVHARATIDGYGVYAGAKAAGMTRGMAVELGQLGIRCNGIAPGYVHAEQNIALLAAMTADPVAWVHQHTHDQQALPNVVSLADCGETVAFLDLAGSITRHDSDRWRLTRQLYNRSFTADRKDQ